MRKLVIGILAHVDAGKTTLSEGMLYTCGTLKRLGRVDHQDAFLDTEALERERGITIFSKQAVLPLPGVEVTLLDTPGHVDFSSEMERTLQVLDCAILVISGTDGVQGHTRTLWRLLERYHIPTLLFVNKMDLAGADRAVLMAELQRLDSGCVDFGQEGPGLQESVAMCDEGTLERYLERGQVEPEEIRALVERRRLFPCWFGSALKLEGVAEFLEGVEQYAPRKCCPPQFGARVYKVARDAQGVRLTYLKITGGSLRVKTPLTGGEGEMRWEEKADQIRIYSGAKYRAVEEAEAGTVCAVTGLSRTRPGEGLGFEAAGQPPVLEPVLTYRLELPEGCDPHAALRQLRELEEEDPQLHILWDERLREIHIQLMGEVQLEILRQVIAQRFGVEVSFGAGSIVYRETIAAPVEGVGHFEPLRHYAEVHLLLELFFGAAMPTRQTPVQGAAQCGALSIFNRLEWLQILLWCMAVTVRLALYLYAMVELWGGRAGAGSAAAGLDRYPLYFGGMALLCAVLRTVPLEQAFYWRSAVCWGFAAVVMVTGGCQWLVSCIKHPA